MSFASQNQPKAEVQSSKLDWASVFQFFFSVGFGAFFLALAALLYFSGGLLLGEPLSLSSAVNTFLVASASLFCSAASFFSAYTSIQKPLLTIPRSSQSSFKHRFWIPLLVYPMLILAGVWVIQSDSFAWLLFPPIHLLASLLPLLWLFWLGSRKLRASSLQRRSGTFVLSLIVNPSLAVFAELVMLFLLVGLAMFVSMSAASENALIESLINLSVSNPDTQQLTELSELIFSEPAFLYLGLFYLAVLTPLIEEIIKPFAVWLLAGKKLTPTDGWVLGLIGGAGFAMFENLWMQSFNADWPWVISIRIATSAIHMLTAAFGGWAIASALQNKTYLKAFLVYLCAVFVHGAWNAGVIIVSYAQAVEATLLKDEFIHRLVDVVPLLYVLLGTIAALVLFLLVWQNKKLARKAVVEYHDVQS